MIVCPNTSPLLVLARLDRLELLGPPENVVLTAAVLAEIRDKNDVAAQRVEALVTAIGSVIEPAIPVGVDILHSLGAGERSVIARGLLADPDVVCILDDAAARTEARRLGLRITGTLGLILRAKVEGHLHAAAPVLEQAVTAGLYLTDSVLAAALGGVGERWPRTD